MRPSPQLMCFSGSLTPVAPRNGLVTLVQRTTLFFPLLLPLLYCRILAASQLLTKLSAVTAVEVVGVKLQLL